MYFFGDLYCTELDLQSKFRVLNKTLVCIDIEELWYRTSNISIDVAEFRYRTSTTSVAYCASTGNCVLKILDVQVSSIEQNSGIEQNLVSNQHYHWLRSLGMTQISKSSQTLMTSISGIKGQVELLFCNRLVIFKSTCTFRQHQKRAYTFLFDSIRNA